MKIEYSKDSLKFLAKTQAELKNAYAKKAYDDVRLQVKKGTKQSLQDVAKEKGESINGYIKNAVQARFKADTGEDIDL